MFLSYARESVAHSERVLGLYALLESMGIAVELDRLEDDKPRDWPVWMERQVADADFVLVVCSPEYRRAADEDVDAGVRRGVRWELKRIRERFYADQKRGVREILAVLLGDRSSAPESWVPGFLAPASGPKFWVPSLDRAGVEALYRVLTGQPGLRRAERGALVVLPSRRPEEALPVSMPVIPLGHELRLDVRVEGGRLRTAAVLDGREIGVRDALAPVDAWDVWRALRLPPGIAEERLAAVGRTLAERLFDDAVLQRLTALVDGPIGTVVDIVIDADGAASALPLELLGLPDGRVLSTVPAVRMRRRVPGVDASAVPPSAGPLKILVALGAPEESKTRNAPLDVEREMQAILDAVGPVGQSGQAQVTILEVGHPEHVEKALRGDAYHVLHLQAHGSSTSLELEDEDGHPVEVSARRLVEMLHAGGRRVPLIVLSSCAGGQGGPDGLAGSLAGSLVASGADRVIAMQAPVTQHYATDLTAVLYETLAGDATASVGQALATARRRVEDHRLAAARGGEPRRLPEYGVPVLVAAGADPPLRDPGLAPVGLAHPLRAPIGGSVRALGLGELIGRRGALREP